jgi:hypothetical protein
MSQTVEWTRQRIVRQMIGLKQYISQLPDSRAMLARMSGKEGEQFLERVSNFIMAELGHPVQTSTAARIARKHVSGD